MKGRESQQVWHQIYLLLGGSFNLLRITLFITHAHTHTAAHTHTHTQEWKGLVASFWKWKNVICHQLRNYFVTLNRTSFNAPEKIYSTSSLPPPSPPTLQRNNKLLDVISAQTNHKIPSPPPTTNLQSWAPESKLLNPPLQFNVPRHKQTTPPHPPGPQPLKKSWKEIR